MSIIQTPKPAMLLTARYREVRQYSLDLIDGLSAEDCQLQSMPDASPLKWHLAHTTWFFETFVLGGLAEPPEPFHPSYRYLFNSYYVGVGPRHTRAERGLLSRPSLGEILDYRQQVDDRITLALASQTLPDELLQLLELGLHHEQQHQELMLTDLKHHFSCNPLYPAWRDQSPDARKQTADEQRRFIRLTGGKVEIGHAAGQFAFDNETPRHSVWLEPFELASHNVSNGEYLAFMADGGYARPELWLSDGWDKVCSEDWRAPLYWQHEDERGWLSFTLHGLAELEHTAAVSHLSFYEADAYARWAGARLPSEGEWEAAATSGEPFRGLHDEVWQWTNSAYLAYPGFKPAAGAVGEYNGKFMINQMVLRGGSLATPAGHARATYRNFFPPQARWQFSGLRLARDPD
jgi:ergothioneine biosynthesis protein EgtB